MDYNEAARLFMVDFIAGGFSGIVAKTVVAPIERIKLLLQTQRVNSRISNTKNYRGGISCLKDIVEKEGVMALWRGNMANVVRYFPNQAFNFALKDKFRRFLGMSTRFEGDKNEKNMRIAVVFWNNIIAGSAAGATTSLLTYPLDVARTRLAADVALVGDQGGIRSRQFGGVWDCIKQSYLEGGMQRVYRGFPLSVCGAAIFRGLFFGGYDNLKHYMDLHEGSFGERYVVAQTLTTVVGTLCYPIDTIKRRMMIQTNFAKGGSAASGMSCVDVDASKDYMNGRQCLRYVLRTEGVKGLYAGLGINLIRGVSGALLLVIYDEAKRFSQKDES